MKTIEQLQEENAALAAQVEALRDALQAVMASIGGGSKFCGHDFDCVCAGDKARAALAATPQHHLREVRVATVFGFVELMPQFAYGVNEKIQKYASQYAEQIRRGEVE